MDTPKNSRTKKRRKVQESRHGDWSKLSPDILRNILETLIPTDSHHAKLVCTDWYSVWKTCSNYQPPGPLRIIHQGQSPMLLDHKEKKIYARKALGLPNIHHCMASSENWLLVVDDGLEFHLLNISTLERIDLPSLRSRTRGGRVKFIPEGCCVWGRFEKRTSIDKTWVSEDISEWKGSVVFSVDERSGDYVVSWTFRQLYLFTIKKGDKKWFNLERQDTDSGFLDVAYKNRKLYVLTTDQHIKVYDYSGDFPREERFINPYRNHPFTFVEAPWEYIWKRKIVIRESGKVLIVLSLKEGRNEGRNKGRLLFYIFRLNRESYKWERVDSIGDEMLVFGQGVTVRAPSKDHGDGIKSGSIYFVDDDVWPEHRCLSNCGVFDIATNSIEWPKKVCYYMNKTQWFVPGVAY